MRRTLTYVLCCVLWTVSPALGIFDMLTLRGLLVNISALAGANRWVLNAIDKFGLFLLGLAWLVFALASESHYRKGVGESDLVRRFGLIIATELSVPVLAYIVPFFIPSLIYSTIGR